MPYPTRNCRQKPVVKDSCSTSQSSFVFFMIHKTKHITISYVHTTSSLLKFKNQEQKKRLDKSCTLSIIQNIGYVFIMLAYLCKLEYQSVYDLLLSFSFGEENIMVCRKNSKTAPWIHM